MPGGYGIPAGFDFAKYDQSEWNFSKKTAKFGLIWHISVFVGGVVAIVAGCFIGIFPMEISSTGLVFYWLGWYLFVVGPILLVIYKTFGMERSRRTREGGYLNHREEVSAYRADLAAWEFTNSERGLGYWRALRGIDFEHAVALMFRRRGCNVTTTKGSGDGGVDLVLYVGRKTLWCQCKGYATPVAVAPIREIAGVCSRANAVPILFAVNGFTKPALAAAEELGVTCLDAPDLCKLARQDVISSAREILRER
jgi:Restriction endonuclease